jgi:hypothetical protein
MTNASAMHLRYGAHVVLMTLADPIDLDWCKVERRGNTALRV